VSRGRHARRGPQVGRERRGLRRFIGPLVVFVAGFVLASTGVASGFWTTAGNGPGQAQAVTLTTPGSGSATSPTTTSLAISWGAASGLPAGGGYKLLRSTTNDGPYTAISGGSCNQTITVVSAATSCTDDDPALLPGTTYYYVVESVYFNGTTIWTSAQSAQFSGTTSQGTLSVATSANPASVTVGGSVDDQATFSGLVNPATSTGTITWKLYAASDANCTGTVFFTSTAQHVTANTTYTSSSFTTTTVGSYKWGFDYTGDTGNAAQSGCGGANEALTVNQATPTVSTSASTNVSVGQSVTDTAALAGGYDPTGTITYTLFGPSPTMACATQVGQVSAKVTSGNGTYVSPAITPAQAGTYWWIANFGGDTNNTATTNACGASGESSVVNRVIPSIITTAKPSSVTVGGSVADQSVLSGGYSPTGTITWSLYANASCTGTPVFTTGTGGAVSGNSTYTSASVTTTAPGIYTWDFSYGGDTNNNPVSVCGGPGQTLTVNATAPGITTSADPATTSVGGSVADQATFTGLVSPATSTGTITWKLYASSDTKCTGTVFFTSSAQHVAANTTYTSSGFTTTTVGSYKWGFSYTGDANNAPVTGCGGATESLTVSPATPHVTTSADPATTAVGGSVADQATFSGLYDPASSTGTVTWALYPSTDTSCSGIPVFASTPQKVTANTTYTSSSFTTTKAGTYTWGLSYTGDADNSPVSACGGTGETLTVGYGTKVIDLYAEAQAYNATHTSNGSSSGTPDFGFYSTGSTPPGCQGGSIDWNGSPGLGTTQAMSTYTATNTSNGKWSNSTIGSADGIGPFTTSPFSGVKVQPHPTSNWGQGGVAAVTKLMIPGSPTGSYQPGATIKVQAGWASGSSVYVYLLNGAGQVEGGGTNPVQVGSGHSMNTTFSIGTPSAGTVYYVAVAPVDSTTTAITLDVTASLPFG